MTHQLPEVPWKMGMRLQTQEHEEAHTQQLHTGVKRGFKILWEPHGGGGSLPLQDSPLLAQEGCGCIPISSLLQSPEPVDPTSSKGEARGGLDIQKNGAPRCVSSHQLW